ncbi:MAG: GAF domain-containing protein [Anaerolineae bacterium]|nr:GAF domain-containing protein [Anaerolineae bacterium]
MFRKFYRSVMSSIRTKFLLVLFAIALAPPLVMGIYTALQAVLRLSSRMQWLTLVMVGVLLFFVLALGHWSANRLVYPLQRLETLAIRMGEGDLETEIALEKTEHPDEIEMLARALDQTRLALLRMRQELELQVRSAERRSEELRTAAQVAAAAAAILNPQELLNNVVTLISERFGFYHTGVFLLDETGTWAILQAASSEGGRRMLVRGHRLRIGEQGIVGYVAAFGEPRVALDVGADAVHFANPDLPDTRSELALPLQSRNRILGVLDVQSVEAEAFGGEDIVTLQILADQIAMAISNAQLFQAAQENLIALQRAHGEYSFQAWVELARTLEGGGYRYHQKALSPAGEIWRPEMARAVREGQVVQAAGRSDTVAIPLRDRDQIIGVMDARKPEGAGAWTEDEITLLETLGRQLEVALGSARSYQETRIREAREQTVRRITDSMRRSLEVDMVAQRAVQELGQTLGAGTVSIRLGTIDRLLSQADQAEDKG